MDTVKVKSLGKALEILEIFSEQPCEYGVSDLARKTGLPKSSIHNILSTFSFYGFLQYNKKTQMYQLGYKALELGNTFQKKDYFISVLQPFMSEISEQTDECVFLAKQSGSRVVYLDALYPENTFGRNIIGVKAPMYCTGIGKAMLAFCDDAFIADILASPLETYTAYTLIDRNALMNEILSIRKNGYAVDNMEHEFGIKCVAVPIFSLNGELLGGLSVSGPSLRFPPETIEKYSELLKNVAQEVKKYL